MARRVLQLAMLLVVVGLTVQTPFKPPSRTTAVSNCPTNPADLAGPRLTTTAAVTCVGWSVPDFNAGTESASVLVRDTRPRPGDSCRDLHFYRVTFVRVDGAIRGTFAIFGG